MPRCFRFAPVCAVATFVVLGLSAVWAHPRVPPAAAPPAQAPVADTVVIGKDVKRTSGVVTALQAGDVACYMTLRDSRGAEFQELADFTICERMSLVGKRVALTYALTKVIADECQGDPACKKTRTVALVTKASVMAGQPASAPPAKRAPQQTSFCTPMETVVFACRTGAKLVSVCASSDASVGKGYLQYRFGKPDSMDPIEITLPEGEPAPDRSATGETVMYSGGGGAWLRFRKGEYAYVVYTGIGKWGPNGEPRVKEGVVVERGGTAIASLPCTGTLTSELENGWFDTVGIQSKGEEFYFPEPGPVKR